MIRWTMVVALVLSGCHAKEKLLERDCVENGKGEACEELASRTRDRSHAEALMTRAEELYARACARGDGAACARVRTASP
jgi:hypothetical protein